MPGRKLTSQDLRAAAEKYKNWGKWGADDEIGTLNYTRPEDIVAAAQLVKKGKVISLALNFDNKGPQGAKSKYPALGRTNPIHTMLRTGTDAYAGVLDHRRLVVRDRAEGREHPRLAGGLEVLPALLDLVEGAAIGAQLSIGRDMPLSNNTGSPDPVARAATRRPPIESTVASESNAATM